MKVYTRLVTEIDGNVLEEQAHEYEGLIAECKGGGGGDTRTVTQTQSSAP